MEKIVGLDWHSATDHQGGTLFWSDIENDKIYRSDWDGQNEKVKKYIHIRRKYHNKNRKLKNLLFSSKY